MRAHFSFGLCLALAARALAQAAEPSPAVLRHDLVRFQAPPGWSCRTVGSDMILAPGEAGFRLVVEHSTALAESLEDLLDRRVAEYASRAGYERQGDRLRTRIAATGVEYAAELFLLRGPDGGAARPGVWLILLGGGGRVVGLRCEFDTPEAFGRHGDAVTALVNAARLGTLERLERGRPPLTRYMVDEATAFLEWLVQSPFTDEQVATVEAELRASWRARDREEIDGMVELLQARQDLAALTAEARELARVQVLEQCLASWREEQATSRGAAMMLAIHASVDRELAPGEPPLTRQAVVAFAEFLHFAGQQVVGVQATLPQELRERLVAGVVAEWPRLGRDQRQLVASMPLGWAALRLRWPEMTGAERAELLASWRDMPQIVALGKAIASQANADAAARQAAVDQQRSSMQEVLRLQQETRRIRASMHSVNISFPQPYRW